MPARFRGGHAAYRRGFFNDSHQRPMGFGRDLYALRKDGSEVPVEIGLSPLETSDGTFVLASVTDITKRKEAEQASHAARVEAERANRLKDHFLAIVSHELRGPLSAVLGWAEMLRAGVLDETRRQRALDSVYVNAKRQIQLIDDLLDVSRILSGGIGASRSAVDLREVARAAMDSIQPAASAKRIELETEFEGAVEGILGDAARLQQILSNLLTNAVKFTPDSGRVRLIIGRRERVVEITVSDSGQGIASDFLPWVFEPFRQGDTSPARVHGGLGLGLAIVKSLVEAHGGTVSAESPGEGRGSSFTVRLPIVTDAGERGPSVSSPADPLTRPLHSLQGSTVLVVDDDLDTRDLITVVLEGADASVLTAKSAADALDLLKSQRIDALLIDIAMPGEDGYALIGRVRALDSSAKATPAAALTSFAGQEDRERSLQAGFQVHLAKPIESRALVDAVLSLVQPIYPP